MDLSDLSRVQGVLKQAQQMQHQMEQKLTETVVEADAGGGVVTVRMNGRKEVLRIKIDPSAMGGSGNDVELLEDLIASAVNEAGRRADEATQSSMKSIVSGFGLPDLS